MEETSEWFWLSQAQRTSRTRNNTKQTLPRAQLVYFIINEGERDEQYVTAAFNKLPPNFKSNTPQLVAREGEWKRRSRYVKLFFVWLTSC